MSEALTIFLNWLLPAGGVLSAIVWITSKRKRDANIAKEVHDTYKAMYEDVHGTLIEIQDENKKLQRSVMRLEKAITKVSTCRYYDNCPIHAELREQKANDNKYPKRRQPANKGDETHDIRADPGEPGNADGSVS